MVSGINGKPRSGEKVPIGRQPNNAAYLHSGGSSRDFYTDTLCGTGGTRAFSMGDIHRASGARRDNGDRIASRGKKKFGEARKEASTRRRFIKHRRGLFLAFTVLFITFLILWGIYKLIFVVNDISVEGNTVYSEEDVLDASGISEGINLYSFRASTVHKSITLKCPYIGDVDIDRNVPDSVVLTVTEEQAVYYANIFGETKLLTAGLRVLETVHEDQLPEGLIRLKLPTVTYSVSGRVIEFAEPKYERIIRDVLSEASESAVADKLTSIDLRDPYEISMICEGRILLVLGSGDDTYMKLATAAAVMQDEMFSTENKIRVDLTIDGKTGVMIDNLMELE